MRLIIPIAALLVPASSAAVQPASPVGVTAEEFRKIPLARDAKVTLPGQRCPDDPRLRLTEEVQRLEPKTLGELPPGNLQLAVLRNVDGCVEPVIVRYGIGGSTGLPSPVDPEPRPRAILRR